MATWAVAVTHLYQQERVVEQFIAKAFDYFFPHVRRTVRHRGRRIHKLEPLLMNYVPVCIVDGWEQIYDMRGVADLLGPAREEEILRIKSQCDSDDILIQPRQSRFKPGTLVKPSSGILCDAVGTFVGTSGDDRDIALFSILGAKRTVKFKEGDLVAA